MIRRHNSRRRRWSAERSRSREPSRRCRWSRSRKSGRRCSMPASRRRRVSVQRGGAGQHPGRGSAHHRNLQRLHHPGGGVDYGTALRGKRLSSDFRIPLRAPRKVINQRADDVREDNNQHPADFGVPGVRLLGGAFNQHPDPEYKAGQDDGQHECHEQRIGRRHMTGIQVSWAVRKLTPPFRKYGDVIARPNGVPLRARFRVEASHRDATVKERRAGMQHFASTATYLCRRKLGSFAVAAR
jgi:hypothetical protein